MNKKVTINYIYNLLFQLLSVSLPILTVPYVSRALGASKLGEYYYVTSIVTYFGIFAVLGTVSFGQREIAKVQNSKRKRSKLFWELFYFRLIFTLISLIIYLVFIIFVYKKFFLLFIVNIFTFLSWIVDVSWYFQGVENFKVTAVRNSIVKICITLFIFILVKRPSDVWIYTLIYSFANFAGNVTMIPYLKGEIEYIHIGLFDIFRNFKEIIELFIPVIAIQLYSVLNRIMLGAMSSTEQVGFFSQIYTVVNLAITLIYAFVAVLTPRIAALYNDNRLVEVRQYTDIAVGYVYLLGLPMMIGSFCLGNLFVPVFFGSGYLKAVPIMYVLSTLYIIVGMGQLLGSFLVAINRQLKYTIAVSITAIINMVLNFWALSLGYKAIGVALVTVLSELICTILQIYFLKDLISLSSYYKYFIHYLPPSVLIILIIFVVRHLPISNNIMELSTALILSVSIYFIYLIIKKDSLFLDILSPLIRRFYKD